MARSIATVIAGALIAASIALMGRWQIVVNPIPVLNMTTHQNLPANPLLYRLDRWTGKVASCNFNTIPGNPFDALGDFDLKMSGGVDIPCEAPK